MAERRRCAQARRTICRPAMSDECCDRRRLTSARSDPAEPGQGSRMPGCSPTNSGCPDCSAASYPSRARSSASSRSPSARSTSPDQDEEPTAERSHPPDRRAPCINSPSVARVPVLASRSTSSTPPQRDERLVQDRAARSRSPGAPMPRSAVAAAVCLPSNVSRQASRSGYRPPRRVPRPRAR